ncbi:hypothetical protein ACTHQ1_14525 [Janibacter anophelis]|uniref:hypothetical protein n=1 Tax=Janibacter anophelis TaxID=319054 RepID=UPI003F823192
MPRTTTTVRTVLSLADIAALARVQRAVVTMWRRRPVVRGELIPFPSAVEVRQGQERFDIADVVEWLARTGRGNNPDYRADALAHAQPSVSLDDSVLDAALDALLCLKARTGLDLGASSPAHILDEADEMDPEDDHLVSELVAAGDQLAAIADYAERLVDASWDAVSADRILRSRRGRGRGADVSLSPEAMDLLGRVGAAMALDLESDIVITDPRNCDPDLVDAVVTQLGERVPAHVLVMGTSARARAARRHHGVRGRSVISVAPAGVRQVVVTRLPLSGPDSDRAAVLAAADDVQLDLTETQRALVVGPAAALCDRLGDDALEQQRDHVVRLGRLRCALRLPSGLVADGSRQVLGVWVLGGAPSSRRVDEQRLAAADLTNETLRADVVEDVVTDVVASLTDHARAAHAFRYARLVATSTLLAESGPLVAAGVRPTRSGAAGPAAEAVVRLRASAAELDDRRVGAAALAGVAVSPGESNHASAEVTIDAAVDAGDLRVIAGTRIPIDGPADVGGVRIIAASDVLDPSTPRRGLDPLVLEASWPRARRSEPGDVVFCASPRPAAIVDREGLSVVASPARVLRCAPGSGLVPEAVARAINHLSDRSPRWRAWRLPRVPVEQTEVLAASLRHLADEEEQARRRLADLAALATELTHGVATGAVRLTPTEEGH